MWRFYEIFYLISLISLSLQINEEFHEELVIKPLPSGHVNSYFQFTTRWNLTGDDDLFHTHLVARPIAEILHKFDLKEFHVSLTQGLWRHELWGYPIIDTSPGAEIWAWFSKDDGKNLTKNDVDIQWKNFCSTLSGILCASLNFVDNTNSIEPKYSFRPKFGITTKTAKNSKYIRYSTLPREIVCTENLTPWKKLLPCTAKSGFTSLLNSGYIYNTNYHSLKISVRTFCDTSKETYDGCIIEITQTANLVNDPKLLDNSGGGSNSGNSINLDFSIRRLFGQGLLGPSCPLAKSSKIYVDITNNNYDISPKSSNIITTKRGGISTQYAVYDTKNDITERLFNIVWKNKNKKIQIFSSPPLYAHRYILGHGHENGEIVTEITNAYWTPLNVVIQENIPWFVPCYLHTLSLKIVENNTEIKPKFINYIPGKQREKPYHLEIGFIIPALKTVEISIAFDYIFLKWLEYPPDANHGHYLGSATITTMLPTGRNYSSIPVEGYLFAHSFNATRSSYFLQIRTESLILSLPTPDFSMPYNVICLACTVVALAFGPIHSIATKRIIIEKKSSTKSFFTKVKEKLFKKTQKSNDNKEKEGNQDESTNSENSASFDEQSTDVHTTKED